MKSLLVLLLCGVLSLQFVIVPGVFAEDLLHSFEEAATGSDKTSERDKGNGGKKNNKNMHKNKHKKNHYAEADDDIGLLELIFYDIWVNSARALAYGGMQCFEYAEKRDAGDRLAPFARLDLSYNEVESDVSAVDAYFEAGYGPFALWYQGTRFDEVTPDTTLKLSYLQAYYRMMFGESVAFGLGLGGTFVDGANYTTGTSFSMPLQIRPWERLGVEYRPVWSNVNGNNIDDHTLMVVGGTDYVNVHAGYRWLESGGVSLDGPVIGVSFSY